jgi:hypothetical protein
MSTKSRAGLSRSVTAGASFRPGAQLQSQIKNNDAIEFEFNYYWYEIVVNCLLHSKLFLCCQIDIFLLQHFDSRVADIDARG